MKQLYKFIFLLILMINESHLIDIDNSIDHSIILRLIHKGVYEEKGLSKRCLSDLRALKDGLIDDQLWAIKMLDSSGSMEPNFVWGNNFWFGVRRMCEDLSRDHSITFSSRFNRNMDKNLLTSRSPMRTTLKMYYFNVTSPYQIDIQAHYTPVLHLGLCIPKSCTDYKFRDLLVTTIKNKEFQWQKDFKMDTQYLGTKQFSFDMKFFNQFCVYLLIGLFGLFGYFSYGHWRNEKIYAEKLKESNENGVKYEREETTLSRLMSCFALTDNMRFLFRNNGYKSSSHIPIICGLKVFSCLWQILFHDMYHAIYSMDNVPHLFMKLENFFYQPFFQAILYVDVFFVIGAILVVRNFLQSTAQLATIKSNSLLDNIKLALRLILHRYVRLTPILVVTMAFSEITFRYLDEASPFWMDKSNDIYCSETWWYNLLYIQNILPFSTQCDSWAWYLACDFQYYLMILPILFIYAKSERVGKGLFVFLMFGCLGLSYFYSYNYAPTFQLDVLYQAIEDIHAQPFIRVNPYMVGVVFGYILFKVKGKKIEVHRSFVILFWAVSALFFMSTLYVTYFKSDDTTFCTLMLSLGRFLIGILIGGVILMCYIGYGGFFTKMLDAEFLGHLNKVSFTIYLISPLVTTALHGFREKQTHFDEISTVIDICGVCIISYILAIPCILFFEIPFLKISDKFIRGRK